MSCQLKNYSSTIFGVADTEDKTNKVNASNSLYKTKRQQTYLHLTTAAYDSQTTEIQNDMNAYNLKLL